MHGSSISSYVDNLKRLSRDSSAPRSIDGGLRRYGESTSGELRRWKTRMRGGSIRTSRIVNENVQLTNAAKQILKAASSMRPDVVFDESTIAHSVGRSPSTVANISGS